MIFHIGDNIVKISNNIIKISTGYQELQDIANNWDTVYKTIHDNRSIEIKANNTLQVEYLDKEKCIGNIFGFTEKFLETY